MHAACPIIEGTKMAISLWIRGNFQDNLKCSIKHSGYDVKNILRNKYDNHDAEIPKHLLKRPTIPQY